LANRCGYLLRRLRQENRRKFVKTAKLGRTDLELPIVGLGAAFVGIPTPNRAAQEYDGAPGGMEDELGIATIHQAIEAGSTLIDTAPLYGKTRSETIIGKALAARPDLAALATVTTKVGQILLEKRDYSYDAIMSDVEASQKRLGIETFEVLYIHDPMDFPMSDVLGPDRALGALRNLQDQGIAKYVGTAANDPETNADYIETGEFDAAIIPEAWSLLNQTAAKRILPAAEKHNVGLVIATPVERGLLATGPSAGTDYLARDFSQTCLDHVTRIQDLCKSHKIPMGAAALQWCTRHPQVAATIPGARTPDEALANARAGDTDIPEDFWDQLAPLIRHFEIGVDR
jgi:D-threo-aldose 1-dehydrogenase